MSDAFETASAAAERLRRQRGGARELLEEKIARIERLDGGINAVVVRDVERARRAADAADAELARYDLRGPLHGVPITVKESFNVAGLRSTWGIDHFRDNLAAADAVAVERLKRAGAIVMGKTNVPVSLADFQSYNPIYGTTRNPFDPARVPGGSSGGSAAALAAGFSHLEFGSDIGGSLRNPAHYCGVYAHKPSWNIVPPRGHSLPGSYAPVDLSVVGPLARSAEDLALALELTAGADERLAAGWRLDLPLPRRERLGDFRVAVWLEDPRSAVSTAVADRIAAVATELGRAGARVSDTARPDFDPGAAHLLYIRLLWSVMAARRPEAEYRAAQEAAGKLAPDDHSDEAELARAAVLSHRDWLIAHHERTRLRHVWSDFFREFDVLLLPVAATTAFPHDQSTDTMARRMTIDGVEHGYWDQLFWAGLATLPYLPSTVAPLGLVGGLPVGVQIVGPEFGDRTTIELARLLAGKTGGFVPPPGFA